MLITFRVADGGCFGAEDGAGLATALGEGCAVCNRLIIAERVRSRLNVSERLAVASRRSGEGLEAGG